MINELDYSTYMPVISKLLRHLLFPDNSKSNNFVECLFQDIVQCKHDELTSENLSNLNTSIKLKTELLRQLMLTHRWKHATKVLSTLFLDVNLNTLSICQLVRVGLELKYQLGLSRNLDSFIDSAILNSPNDALTIEVDRFLHEVALKFENGFVIGNKNSSYLENFAVNLRDAKCNSSGKRKKNKELIMEVHIDMLYAGAVSYIQAILSDAELVRIREDGFIDDLKIYEMQEENYFQIVNLQETVKTHTQNANSYLNGALELCKHGPWDSIINMHIDLLRRFQGHFPNYQKTTRQILETFCEFNPLNKNGWKMLAKFYVSLKLNSEAGVDDDVAGKGLEALEKICEIDCFDETSLLLVESGLSKNPNLCYLFKMLDGFQWKNDQDVWQSLAKELIKLSTSELQEDKLLVEKEWTHRSSWWPKYHFQNNTENFNNIDFVKAVVAGLLLGRKNKFFKRIWKERDSCKLRDLNNLLIISYNLNIKLNVIQHSPDSSNDDDLEIFTFNDRVIIL